MDKDWTHRAAVSVDNTTSAQTAEDVTITLDSEWPEFWGNVDNAGDDVRVTDADGVTLESYKLVGFNSTTRVCTVQVDNVSLVELGGSAATAGVLLWIYWGNANATAAGSVFTISGSEKTGTVQVGTPGSGSQRVVMARPETPGSINPRTEVHKMASETIHLWWNLAGVLASRHIPSQGSRAFEEIHNVRYSIEAAGSPQASMRDTADIRMAGPGWVRTTIKGGTSGTNYVAILLVELTGGRALDFRTTIRVQDVTEPT
jgi:hypothetical protein